MGCILGCLLTLQAISILASFPTNIQGSPYLDAKSSRHLEEEPVVSALSLSKRATVQRPRLLPPEDNAQAFEIETEQALIWNDLYDPRTDRYRRPDIFPDDDGMTVHVLISTLVRELDAGSYLYRVGFSSDVSRAVQYEDYALIWEWTVSDGTPWEEAHRNRHYNMPLETEVVMDAPVEAGGTTLRRWFLDLMIQHSSPPREPNPETGPRWSGLFSYGQGNYRLLFQIVRMRDPRYQRRMARFPVLRDLFSNLQLADSAAPWES